LQQAGCETICLEIESIEQLHEAIQTIGEATGKQAEADQLNNLISSRLESIRQQSQALEPVKVLWVVERQPIRVAGKNTFLNELLEIAGAANVVEMTLYQYPPIDEEQILVSAPDVILETAYSAKDLQRQQDTAGDYYGRFKTLPAVQQERIYVLDGDLVCRLGPRLPLGAEAVMDCIRRKNPEKGGPDADL